VRTLPLLPPMRESAGRQLLAGNTQQSPFILPAPL
jgi:hypothetical protein